MINKIQLYANKYNVPNEDALFIFINRMGVASDLPYGRVRFIFQPFIEDEFFVESKKQEVKQYFFALPNGASKTPFSVKKESENYVLYCEDYKLGYAIDLMNDTCDSEYTRNCGKTLNLNPISKSFCHGCKFCHTLVQDSNEFKDTRTCDGLKTFFREWMKQKRITNLSELEQIAVVTGTFGGSSEVLNYLRMLREQVCAYGYSNEIFYFGAELDVESLLNIKDELLPFAWCYTLECFENRDLMLRKEKANQTPQQIFSLLKKLSDNGITTNFSYVLGIDSLDAIRKGMEAASEAINRFPIINIFQTHKNSETGILTQGAEDIGYFFEARKIIEDIFGRKNLAPRTWENFRSLWCLRYNGESLKGNRLP